MWPTSIPRAMVRRAAAPGLGVARLDVAEVHAAGRGRSRSQFTPVRCSPAALAPHTKSARHAGAVIGDHRHRQAHGPDGPDGAPAPRQHASGEASRSGLATPGSALGLQRVELVIAAQDKATAAVGALARAGS